jgi:hypothetical protein
MKLSKSAESGDTEMSMFVQICEKLDLSIYEWKDAPAVTKNSVKIRARWIDPEW